MFTSMKRLSVLAISILFVLTTSLQAATPKTPIRTLAPYTSRIGAFSVLMPGSPTYKTETVKTDNGPVVLHKYIAEAQNGNHAYLVAYSDFSGRIDPTYLFNYTRQDALNIIKGRVISERPTSLDGYPGRVLKMENGEHTVTMKMYLVGKRFYKQIFVMTKGMNYPAEADRFFASFKVGANANTLARR